MNNDNVLNVLYRVIDMVNTDRPKEQVIEFISGAAIAFGGEEEYDEPEIQTSEEEEEYDITDADL